MRIPAEDAARAEAIMLRAAAELQEVRNGSAVLLFEEGSVVWGLPDQMAQQLSASGYDRQAAIVRKESGPGWVVTVILYQDGGALVSRLTLRSPGDVV